MGSKSAGVEKRENWGSQFGLVMAMAGMSVGLGNCWRFPYLVGEYGGGTFVLAYLACVILIVFPLCIVEVGFGKRIGKGLIDCYAEVYRNRKAGIAVGGASAFLYFAMNFFYIFIIANCVRFMWGSLTSVWNTVQSDQIYESYLDNTTVSVVFTVAMILLISFIVYKGITGGIEKVSKIMVPLIFVFFAITILLTALNVDGISAGYNYFFNPDLSRLKELDLWIAAMGQALFSIGVGPGCMLIYGSHIEKKGDVTLTVATICALCTCVGILAGTTIIPACIALGLEPASGDKLIFVVLPAIFAKIPMGNIIGVLVFGAIFFAGITSAIAQLEVAITTFSDGFKITRAKVVVICTVITLIFAVPAIYSQSMMAFWTELAGNYSFILTAAIGAVSFNWIYKVTKIREEAINPTSLIKLGNWFDPYVKYICVPILLICLANSIWSSLNL
ncbi:MAG: sodium-dependent transporter [Lachnospiraceae bacterium]